MKNSILFFLAAGLLFQTACKKDFLDRSISTELTEKEVFSSYARTRDFLVGTYAYLPDGFGRFNGAMLDAATDDAEFTNEGNEIQRYNTGSWNPYVNPDDNWNRSYTAIRRTNLFLENSGNVNLDNYKLNPASSSQETYRKMLDDLERWRYEARFLRAYFYFELIKRYGGVPLIKRSLEISENLDMARTPFDDCVQFIADECDSAALHLPPKAPDVDLGRVTKGAALALKSRVLLYWASPLNNPSNLQDRWKKAAAAAHDVLALNAYQLENDYKALFRSFTSKEIIFAHRYSTSNDFERANYPIGYDGGQSGTTPTQDLVDAYEMADGSKFSWSNPVHAAAPYDNRDPRLKMTVIVNNSQWKNRVVEAWTGGRDGKGIDRASRTGYYLKKYVDENLDLLQNKASVHTWILFRLGEIYLNYAEAMNEAYGPDQDPEGYGLTAIDAINNVRKRNSVNMPQLIAGDWQKQSFREKVQNERRVEMAFEEQRYWDVRRWNLGTQLFNGPVRGVNITRTAPGVFQYAPFTLESRVFLPHMNRYPIPDAEKIKSPSLVQTPGW
ncbi:hypothetical protein J2T02_003780 [Chitinophaga terrae (ex Kim and Jung 2007)]|uniref:RagB/SusD family nutrient uptake outer membrane protein n=1 Tax=Chitinophaga terrae (ex Kim and Jung 2007) TaxID=408074 RepID=UPI0027814BB3|nr:RagB/SusD family nutrient uptake outer membrane protein [Chitinophaga terrae (ex Kim and Jung 2007)]MDQ0108641.1 hypothetical protein [Chitinophaga terrae (ex Kim and Jung 2007)]